MGFVLPAGNSSGNLGAANLLPSILCNSKAKPGPRVRFQKYGSDLPPCWWWIWLHLLDRSSTLSAVQATPNLWSYSSEPDPFKVNNFGKLIRSLGEASKALERRKWEEDGY